MVTALATTPPGPHSSHLDWIRYAMRKGDWWTFQQIQNYLPMRVQETTISARLRDLRKEGLIVESRHVKGNKGLWEYRVVRQQKLFE